MVKTYHVSAKIAKSVLLYSKTSDFVKRVLIEFASVLRNKDARGLKRSGYPGLIGLHVHFYKFELLIYSSAPNSRSYYDISLIS